MHSWLFVVMLVVMVWRFDLFVRWVSVGSCVYTALWVLAWVVAAALWLFPAGPDVATAVEALATVERFRQMGTP